MGEIFAGDEAITTIDPLVLKRRKNPWRKKRIDFRVAGPGKPNSSNGKRFLKKLHRRTIAFDLS